MYDDFVLLVRQLYPKQECIPLHEPKFIGNEKKYLNECIDSTYVSSVGKFVDQFEQMIAKIMQVDHAVAVVNGTSALHICLLLAGVAHDDEVITQPLTFVATCNAIAYCCAHPVFVDVDIETMGMSPKALQDFLSNNTYQKAGECYNKKTKRRIKACVPMHTFGHACKIDQIKQICTEHNLILIEDAAEAVGSSYKGKALGAYGDLAALSFNGNKIVTAGGGGAILTNNASLARLAKHLTTTAKVPHKWKYEHDCVGYNYRMPNVNAALLCAQLENLDQFLENKRDTAKKYRAFFDKYDDAAFILEPESSHSNYWLNAIKLKNQHERDQFLEVTNAAGVMVRPVWMLMNHLQMYRDGCYTGLENAELLEKIVVNIPSSVRL